MKPAQFGIFGLPTFLSAFGILWFLSAAANILYRVEAPDVWMPILLFEMGLIAAILIIYARSFSVALAYTAGVLLNFSLLYPYVTEAGFPFERVSLTMLGAWACDLLSLVALWFSWRRAEIQPLRIDWIASLSACVVVIISAFLAFGLSLFVPGRLEAFTVFVLAIGAIAFAMIKRTLALKS